MNPKPEKAHSYSPSIRPGTLLESWFAYLTWKLKIRCRPNEHPTSCGRPMLPITMGPIGCENTRHAQPMVTVDIKQRLRELQFLHGAPCRMQEVRVRNKTFDMTVLQALQEHFSHNLSHPSPFSHSQPPLVTAFSPSFDFRFSGGNAKVSPTHTVEAMPSALPRLFK